MTTVGCRLIPVNWLLRHLIPSLDVFWFPWFIYILYVNTFLASPLKNIVIPLFYNALLRNRMNKESILKCHLWTVRFLCLVKCYIWLNKSELTEFYQFNLVILMSDWPIKPNHNAGYCSASPGSFPDSHVVPSLLSWVQTVPLSSQVDQNKTKLFHRDVKKADISSSVKVTQTAAYINSVSWTGDGVCYLSLSTCWLMENTVSQTVMF